MNKINYALTTLSIYQMEWCYCILCDIRNRLSQIYIQSIENNISFDDKNAMNINIKAAEKQSNPKVKWNNLVIFVEDSVIRQDAHFST